MKSTVSISLAILLFVYTLSTGCSQSDNGNQAKVDSSKDTTVSSSKQKRPNILFVMTDDHSRHAISAYGSKLVNTPNIDYIANNGVLFNNCAVTNAICGPSRAVALTGKYSHINGFKDNRSHFDGSQQTFPKLLQKAGYYTMMVGKWHLHSKPQGFDYWNILIGQGDYYKPKMIENGDTMEIPGYVTDVVTDISLDKLANRDQDKPFCLMYHQKAPHRNWMPNVKHLDLYRGDTLPIPDNFFDAYENRSNAAKEQDLEVKDMYMSFDMKLDPGTFADSTETGTGGSATWDAINSWKNSYNRMTAEQKTTWDKYYKPMSKEFYTSSYSEKELAEWKYQRYIKDYLRCIVSVDENLGRMIEYLKKTGEWENTLVIYTSDQGFFLGEHGWYDKRFMYEESLITPFIMKVPHSDSAKINNDLVMNLDFAPTILDYAGLKIPQDMQGKSLKPVMEGKTFERYGQYYHYYEFPHGWHLVKKHYGVRTASFKLIRYYGDTVEWEMFDLKNDPHEMNNIFNSPKYKIVKKELLLMLTELRAKYKEEE
ncbi:MAG: arylsulfatase A-like enzyme [Saprospiraceae bacterium]|jgi:arylsulfatase A-like enzyme